MTLGPGILRTALPKGFRAGGINCGVRRYRPDLGIIYSEKECVVSGVFTQSKCKASAVRYCQQLLPSNNIKAIVTNSGQANAATGELGNINNQKMADAVAVNCDCKSNQVLTASTGVIGEQMPIDKITHSMPLLVSRMTDIAEKFAVAILTTDLVPKTVRKEVSLSNGSVAIVGVCKGSGMIHPNMATMLGYVLTDAGLSIEQSSVMIKKACDKSFNMISVDGDTSTNDSVFFMSNGMSQVKLQKEDEAIFYQALEEVCIVLAKGIARDGEGVTKLLEVMVSGVNSDVQARKIARHMTTSSLIKTAICGESPNWGRVLARLGSSDVSEVMLDGCDIAIQGIPLLSKGEVVKGVDMDSLALKMKKDTINVSINFNHGDSHATAWGCDLTQKYVQINAEYLS